MVLKVSVNVRKSDLLFCGVFYRRYLKKWVYFYKLRTLLGFKAAITEGVHLIGRVMTFSRDCKFVQKKMEVVCMMYFVKSNFVKSNNWCFFYKNKMCFLINYLSEKYPYPAKSGTFLAQNRFSRIKIKTIIKKCFLKEQMW